MTSAENYGMPWTRDELVLAFDLYCRIPFNRTKPTNPDVIELATLLKRSPGSVARKLGNFGSFDPDLRKRSISGLVHASRLDAEVWDEFRSDWDRLVMEAWRLREALRPSVDSGPEDPREEESIEYPQGPSESESMRKTRVHQRFFRDAVLSSYENACCVTGLRIPQCLIASHIVPWSVDESCRVDPRNGLCLSATFDRLFDCGLVTVSSEYRVSVSPQLLLRDDSATKNLICGYHGAPIVLPRRFKPLPDYLEWHRRNRYMR